MRCRKAHWFLSARCDGTLSERQRLRLEAHLESCEACRREAFYFSEIGSQAARLAPRSVQPDFNLRLRAAIRRADDLAARPISRRAKFAGFVLRPAFVAASIVVLGLGGVGAWHLTHRGDAASFTSTSTRPVSTEYGLSVPAGPMSPAGELIPVDAVDDEAARLRDRYLETGDWQQDFVVDGVPLNDSNGQNINTRYVLPTVSPDQVAKDVSY